mgnify:CR=1 FL=1
MASQGFPQRQDARLQSGSLLRVAGDTEQQGPGPVHQRRGHARQTRLRLGREGPGMGKEPRLAEGQLARGALQGR